METENRIDTTRTRRSPAALDRRLGKNLKIFRKLAALSQVQVARKLGVTFQQVQKYESGQNRVSPAVIIALSELYAVPVENLFAGLIPGKPRLPATLLLADDMTLQICSQLATVHDKSLKRKIGQVVSLLAA